MSDTLRRLCDRIPYGRGRIVRELVEVGEHVLALEILLDNLVECEQPVSEEEASDLSTACAEAGVDPRWCEGLVVTD